MLTLLAINPNLKGKRVKQILLAIAVLFTSNPAEAGDRRLKKLEQSRQFVDAWRLEEQADKNLPATEGFGALRTTWAFVSYDPTDNVVVVHPYGQPWKTIRVAVPWANDGETAYHMLRYFGFRTVFTTADDRRTAELLRPYAQHTTVYINNPDSCPTTPCETFVVVILSRWNE
jgi:hypothetical protein